MVYEAQFGCRRREDVAPEPTRTVTMNFDDLGKSNSESDFDNFDEYASEDRNPTDSVHTEDLERWLNQNHALWQLGLHLASVARQYRREYEYVPFNQTGWFNPN